MTIVEFLTARLDEDESVVRAWQAKLDTDLAIPASLLGGLRDPKYMHADIASKRAIVHQHGANDGAHECPEGFMDGAETEPHIGWELVCMTQRYLAIPYADHPDYQQEWKP